VAIVVRPLRPEDDRTGFTSGDSDLDRFFHKYAGGNQFRLYVGATYVAYQDHAILGFFTVSPGEIEVENPPDSARKRYPKYPLPMLRLARLAVDQRHQKKGIGSLLLGRVLSLALQMPEEVGCIGVVVDALPGAVAFYEKYSFTALEVFEGHSGIRPRPVAMFLSMPEIKENG